MAKDYQIVKLLSTAGTGHFYTTTKSRKGLKVGNKIELMKYDPKVRKHVLYKETKIK